MLRNLLSLSIVCLFTYTSAFAQGTITGTVTDAQSGETLPGVNVVIQELQRGTATDADGNYTISDVSRVPIHSPPALLDTGSILPRSRLDPVKWYKTLIFKPMWWVSTMWS